MHENPLKKRTEANDRQRFGSSLQGMAAGQIMPIGVKAQDNLILKTSRCNSDNVYKYLYPMKSELTIPEHFPDPTTEDKKAADRRREEYSIARNILVQKDNEAIARRLAKESEKPE